MDICDECKGLALSEAPLPQLLMDDIPDFECVRCYESLGMDASELLCTKCAQSGEPATPDEVQMAKRRYYAAAFGGRLNRDDSLPTASEALGHSEVGGVTLIRPSTETRRKKNKRFTRTTLQNLSLRCDAEGCEETIYDGSEVVFMEQDDNTTVYHTGCAPIDMGRTKGWWEMLDIRLPPGGTDKRWGSYSSKRGGFGNWYQSTVKRHGDSRGQRDSSPTGLTKMGDAMVKAGLANTDGTLRTQPGIRRTQPSITEVYPWGTGADNTEPTVVKDGEQIPIPLGAPPDFDPTDPFAVWDGN
jgi:hypothetical protein